MRALVAPAAAVPSCGQLHGSEKETFLSLRSNKRIRSSHVTSQQRRRHCRLQVLRCHSRPNHISDGDDADDVLDDLLNKYGKVVYRRGDQKSPTAEVDDDAESLSFAVTLAKVASDVKAADIRDVVVHIFLPQQRAFYNLEEFYGNATPIELPFDTPSSFRN